MKKVITQYMNDMTSGDLETLEKIISFQYKKFVRFYKLIHDYSGLISKLKYEFNSASSLDVLLYMDTKRDLKKLCDEIEDMMKKSEYDGEVSVVKKNIFISLVLDEESGN